LNPFTCTLPAGYVDARGDLHREAELIPLGGKEEELLAGRGPGPVLVTGVLSRCVRRIGEVEPVSPEVARGLLVADRQYLLLKLRELTFGDRVRGIVACPWPGCGEGVEVNFSLADIPVQGLEGPATDFRLRLSPEATAGASDGPADGHGLEVRYRLPNGGDEERLAALVEENEAEALTALLQRCVMAIDGIPQPSAEQIADLSARARAEVEADMENKAPRLGLEMVTRCPSCERQFTLPFELRDFFFGELSTSLDLLYREVHYLAFHYHWSESEILAMPRDKRRAYIELLSGEIEKMSHAV
jgi:hypothetical protein